MRDTQAFPRTSSLKDLSVSISHLKLDHEGTSLPQTGQPSPLCTIYVNHLQHSRPSQKMCQKPVSYALIVSSCLEKTLGQRSHLWNRPTKCRHPYTLYNNGQFCLAWFTSIWWCHALIWMLLVIIVCQFVISINWFFLITVQYSRWPGPWPMILVLCHQFSLRGKSSRTAPNCLTEICY